MLDHGCPVPHAVCYPNVAGKHEPQNAPKQKSSTHTLPYAHTHVQSAAWIFSTGQWFLPIAHRTLPG